MFVMADEQKLIFYNNLGGFELYCDIFLQRLDAVVQFSHNLSQIQLNPCLTKRLQLVYLILFVVCQRDCKVAVLEGHDGLVTAAEFCPHYTATLVSISEDRTFKVITAAVERNILKYAYSIVHEFRHRMGVIAEHL